jgi:hypothetical protein
MKQGTWQGNDPALDLCKACSLAPTSFLVTINGVQRSVWGVIRRKVRWQISQGKGNIEGADSSQWYTTIKSVCISSAEIQDLIVYKKLDCQHVPSDILLVLIGNSHTVFIVARVVNVVFISLEEAIGPEPCTGQ